MNKKLEFRSQLVVGFLCFAVALVAGCAARSQIAGGSQSTQSTAGNDEAGGINEIVVMAEKSSTSRRTSQTEANSPQPVASEEMQEEILVTGNASSRNRELARHGKQVQSPSRNGVDYFGFSDSGSGGLVAPAIASAQPDEEIWIISRSAKQDEPADLADDSPGSGAMIVYRPPADDESAGRSVAVPMPLKHTSVKAQVTGYVGSVRVTQEFENPFAEKIEAVYLFPLPEKAAVSEFVMKIGDRKIRGILREKEEAEKIYHQARAQGYQASLLTQHRPNIFEQKVANIEPGKSIDVDIRYFHTLAYNDGWYSFVFPTVVGPRYNPPGLSDPIHTQARGSVPPPAGATAIRYLRPQERSGHDISIDVDIDAGVRIEELTASHAIVETRTGVNTASVALANEATVPNRDFILNFKVAGGTVKSNLLTYTDPNTAQGYFTLMMYPPDGYSDLGRQPMEMVFVLDCSGSMRGQPMQQAKQAVLEALSHLNEDDSFQIIRFSSAASQLGAGPLRATKENLGKGRAYVRHLNSHGGTQMIEGIRAALDFPHDQSRLRFVTFLTDGYIGNEADIIGAVHSRLGESRIFSFGVGSSVNRFLMERMAAAGRGAVAYLGPDADAGEVMNFFFDRISHPAITDIEIDWGGMHVSDVYPSRIPDLFVGRPVVITGKYLGDATEVRIAGRAGPMVRRFSISKEQASPEYAFVPKIWARRRIADLADQQTWTSDPDGSLGEAIRATALSYQLMSRYTAFVAVDAATVTAGSYGTTVHQAVPVPDGVRYETTVEER